MSVLDYFKKDDRKKKPVKPAEPVDKKPEIKPEFKEAPAPLKDKSELASLVLESPHISEKGTFLAESNQYIFRVSARANKSEIKKAVGSLYKVKVVKVNIINEPSRPKSLRGRPGYRPGYKKAVVILKKGDKIEIAL